MSKNRNRILCRQKFFAVDTTIYMSLKFVGHVEDELAQGASQLQRIWALSEPRRLRLKAQKRKMGVILSPHCIHEMKCIIRQIWS